MAKLHELLAVEQDLAGTFKTIIAETMVTFTKRADHFMGFNRSLEWHKDGEPPSPPEHKALDTTVQKRLDYQQKSVVRYLDAVLQKEATNQITAADIVIDGVIIATGIPATYLLGLETKLKHLRETYAKIPTLSPGTEWQLAPDKGEGIYEHVHPEKQFKTERIIVPQILYEATKEHPAQVEKLEQVQNVGTYTRQAWSGMMTPAEKSKLLGKIDKLSRAVKKARQRANNTDIVKKTIGKELFDFINS
jgi:hypothetical protein